MVILHMPMHFHPSQPRNVGGVRKNVKKMVKFDQFIAPGDLDLGRVTLTLVPGRHFFQDTYTYQVSSRTENGKVVKIAGITDADARHGGLIHLLGRR